MLLDRIDIDSHGPLVSVELGPLAEHLNVVLGPGRSGKTAIVRFIRDSLVDRDYPLGMLSSSAGRVVWADRYGLVHCRREADGTPQGRRSVEFESRNGVTSELKYSARSWLGGHHVTDSTLALRALQLPESIVDGVITDTTLSSVARVVSACVRSGLDSQSLQDQLPLDRHTPYHTRDGLAPSADDNLRYEQRNEDAARRIRQQLADVEAELTRRDLNEVDRDTLVRRRQRVIDRLASIEHEVDLSKVDVLDEFRPRLAECYDRVRNLRAKASELRRWIQELDREIAQNKSSWSERRAADFGRQRNQLADEHLRRQLDELDAQAIRWRRALSEVRGLRQAVVAGDVRGDHGPAECDEDAFQRYRLHAFLDAVDRFDSSSDWSDFYSEPSLHRIDDIEQRIEAAGRHIDWLLRRYENLDVADCDWYQADPVRPAEMPAATLRETLCAIRDDLRSVQRDAGRGPRHLFRQAAEELQKLRHDEQWLTDSMAQLNHRRDVLLREAAWGLDDAEMAADRRLNDLYLLNREREESVATLSRVGDELDQCLAQASRLRQGSRRDGCTDRYDPQREDREQLEIELKKLDEQLAVSNAADPLLRRRRDLIDQLAAFRLRDRHATTLAGQASRWLIRLTAGRLKQIRWQTDQFTDSRVSYYRGDRQRTGVMIDGRDECYCDDQDRRLAALAVRMAAGDLLSRCGNPIPLVVEIDALTEQTRDNRSDRSPEVRPNAWDQETSAMAAALADYTRAGRQIVVMTSNEETLDHLKRLGSRVFELHAERVVHPHRPLWRSQYGPESYAGPHPHVYGVHTADRTEFAMPFDGIPVDRTRAQPSPLGHANRDFDVAWRESQDIPIDPTPVRTDWARDGLELRDGYYYADRYTTSQGSRKTSGGAAEPDTQPQRSGLFGESVSNGPSPLSPFYLTVDSPIDQAPSVDAVAAARLRGLQVTHINHLMRHDPNRLSDALGLANVDASTIRRWQAECRLVCRVPHLRSFDARVLVGCGIKSPSQLAAIHPVDLLQEVEAFLATERGQQVLLSGTSHELSRITSWMAKANSGSVFSVRDATSSDSQVIGGSSRRRRDRTDRDDYSAHSTRQESARRRRRRRRATLGDPARNTRDVIYEYEPSSAARRRRAATPGSTGQSPSRRRSRDAKLRFFLATTDPVVDAPEIGPRMAERLNEIGIRTVADLISADPDTIAVQLEHSRVTSATVVHWQQQATLVCRVPMLRGHDAQLLVAAEVTTAEQLAESSPEELFEVIEPIARSSEGKRIIRSGHPPDLEEVTNWVYFGGQHRALVAA